MAATVLSLNLMQARTTLSPYEAAPVEFPDGQFYYKSESVAAGGSQFSHHRLMRCAIYAKDCLPTENGYESVVLRPIEAHPYSEDNCRLEWVQSCNGEEETLFSYDPEDVVGVTSHLMGHLVLDVDGTVLQTTNVSDDCDTTWEACPREFKGIDSADNCIKGMVRFKGHTLLYTSSQIFYNGAEDPFDFTPNIRTTAGSYGILHDIGAIMHIVPAHNGIYVLGKRGGVYGECSGDLHFPVDYEHITNFDGIPYRDAALADYNVDSLVVFANNGLMKLSGTRAELIYPDVSRFLRDGRYSTLTNPCTYQPDECQTQPTESIHPFPATVFDPCEFRDNYECCDYSDLYREYNVIAGCNDLQHIAVNNVSPRYTTVSYASNLTKETAHSNGAPCKVCNTPRTHWSDPENYMNTCPDCRDNEYTDQCYCYNRLLVLDHSLQRSTVLHVPHTDVIRPRHSTRAEFVIADHDDVYEVRLGPGLAELYFHEFERGDNRVLIITNLDVRGRFPIADYQAALDGDDARTPLYQIHTLQGVDRQATWLNTPWLLTEIGTRQIQYGGLMRAKNVSFILPFVGRLTHVGLSIGN